MANRTSALPHDDREELRAFIGEKLDLDQPAPHFTAETAKLIAALDTEAAYGHDLARQEWATRARTALAIDGARGHVERAFKEAETVIYRSAATGPQTITVPARVGVKAHGERYWQQRLWWELTWAEFAQWLALWAGRHDRQEVALEEFRRVARLQAAYPASTTPGEACTLAGIDPRAIDWDTAGVA